MGEAYGGVTTVYIYVGRATTVFIYVLYMGRKQKYKTEEEKLNARRERQMRYYFKNQKLKQSQSLQRYYDYKENK
jgi:hypothetical protein